MENKQQNIHNCEHCLFHDNVCDVEEHSIELKEQNTNPTCEFWQYRVDSISK